MVIKLKTKAVIGVAFGLTAYGLMGMGALYFTGNRIAELQSKETLRMFSESAFQTLLTSMNFGSAEMNQAAIEKASAIEGVKALSVSKGQKVIDYSGGNDTLTDDPRILKVFETGRSELIETTDGEHLVRILKPFKADESCLACHANAQEGDVLGVMDLTISREASDATLYRALTNVGLGVLVLTLVAGGLISLIIQKGVIGPIQGLLAMLQDMARGEGDLTRRLPVVTNDEFGELAETFNQFVGNLGAMIKESQNSTHEIAKQLKEMSEQSLVTSDAIKEITTAVNDEDSILQTLAENAGTLNLSVQDVQKTVQDTVRFAETNKEGTVKGVQSVEEVTEIFGKINSSSKAVFGIMAEMQEIAGKTNLLSLNAAIEAAKAGEFGKGFAVVAEEVRSLADQSNRSTQKIGELIEESGNRLETGQTAVTGMMEIFTTIEHNAEEVVQALHGIASKATEQVHALETTAEGITDMLGLSDQITDLCQQLTQISDTLLDLREGITQHTQGLTELMDRFKV